MAGMFQSYFHCQQGTESRAAPSHPPFPPSSGMDTDIPQEVFDQIAEAETSAREPSSGIRYCPHCTFENTHGGSDCEVCGLPLS
jgi:nuclear protein localization family protein 4